MGLSEQEMAWLGDEGRLIYEFDVHRTYGLG
jgi:hypothetical protein